MPDTHPTLRGPRLRRRRARRPDRQHRRRPPDRLGRRVQQLPRPVRAVRHRDRQPPGAAAAVRVPVRALGRRRAPTRRAQPTTGDSVDAARNGEPNGELGLVTQKDHGLWQQQTGGPTDPQAGQHPRRQARRPAHRRLQRRHDAPASRADSGVWTGRPAATLQVAAALARPGRGRGLLPRPVPAGLLRDPRPRCSIQKPTGGWKANAYVIFDYFSPTDFKFAGIDVATNKVVVGHRTPQGWIIDATGVVTGSVKSDTWYDMLVDRQRPRRHRRRQRTRRR